MTLLTSPALALLIRTTFLLGLALLAVRLLRGPAVHTLAGRAALAAVALLLLTAPLTKFVPPLWHIPAPAAPRPVAPAPIVTLAPTPLPPLEISREEASGKRAGASPAPTDAQPPTPTVAATPPAPVRTPTPPLLGAGGLLLLVLWATGTALLLLWLAICQWHLIQLHRRAIPLTDGPAFDALTALTPNPPRLYACPGIDGPFLAGLVRPDIYLPADHAETFSPDALRAVLAHELAHAERHDTRWTLASRLLCALLWPQPLLWLLCRTLDHVSEDACDLAVLSYACPPRIYADCLLTLAERRPLSRRTSPLTAGLVPFRSQLARRIQHILTVKGNPPMPAVTARLRLAIAAATIVIALGGTLLFAAPAPLASWQPVSADLRNPLVGMWLFKDQPISGGKDALLIYRADGQEEFIAPGTDGHEAEHSYFNYRVNGNELTEKMKDQGTNDLPTVLHFDIGKNMLTIHDAIEDSSGKRVADAAQASLVEKMLTATDAQPATVIMHGRSTLASLTEAQLLAGLTPVQGPGIIVTLRDSKKLALHMPTGFAPPNIIHDTDIAAVVNELQAAGAEAISINGQRLVATSAVRCVGPDVMVNFMPLAAPFVIKAIGSPATLLAKVNLPGGITTQIRTYDPAMLSVQTAETLTLPAYGRTMRPQFDTSPALSSIARTDFLAGLTAVQGPGIIVTLNDSKLPPVPLPAGFTPPNLIHDSDINSVVNELKASGAEAISVNGQRLVATSPIRSVGPAILINATPQAAPFVIQAIGNPKTLLSGVELPGGVTKSIRAYDPAMFTTKVSPKPLLLPAYSGTATPQYAKPASAKEAIPAVVSHRTFEVNFRVPRPGTHRIQVFVNDDTGQRSVYDKIGKPGANIMVPITAEGKSVTFRIYDNGKLIQTKNEANTGTKQGAEMKGVSAALLAQRNHLISQLNNDEAHVKTSKAILYIMQRKILNEAHKLMYSQTYVTPTAAKIRRIRSLPRGEEFEQQIDAARSRVRHYTNLPPQNSDRVSAQNHLDVLLSKQQFFLKVMDNNQNIIVLDSQEMDARENMMLSLAKYYGDKLHLLIITNAIDQQIAAVKANKSSH